MSSPPRSSGRLPDLCAAPKTACPRPAGNAGCRQPAPPGYGHSDGARLPAGVARGAGRGAPLGRGRCAWLRGRVGLTDMDALTYSMSRLGVTTGDAPLAARAIAIGLLSNTVLKLGWRWSGRPAFRRSLPPGFWPLPEPAGRTADLALSVKRLGGGAPEIAYGEPGRYSRGGHGTLCPPSERGHHADDETYRSPAAECQAGGCAPGALRRRRGAQRHDHAERGRLGWPPGTCPGRSSACWEPG